MGKPTSLEVETLTHRNKPQNPYNQTSPTNRSSSNARLYFVLSLAFFAFYGIYNSLSSGSDSDRVSTGDAAGGWGKEHNHEITHHDTSLVKSYQKEISKPYPNTSYTPYSPADTALKAISKSFLHEDFETALGPIVTVPSHSLPEYSQYQSESESIDSSAKLLLNDKNTPHGKAFDFVLNRDKRRVQPEDPRLVQRYVLALLFYATGGRDADFAAEEGERRGGWDAESAHFLTGLHECHWVKKSLRDQFWELLSMEADGDRKVGVTKCNDDMEVTEIRLADLNLIGFIPAEIKWLSSLESLDIQNNHVAGPIPTSLGELDELRYLSLDGNNFSGSIPDVFHELTNLERAYLNFNDFNGAMAPSLCTLRETGSLTDLWSDCGGYPITCTCCTVCCDMVAECDEMQNQNDD